MRLPNAFFTQFEIVVGNALILATIFIKSAKLHFIELVQIPKEPFFPCMCGFTRNFNIVFHANVHFIELKVHISNLHFSYAPVVSRKLSLVSLLHIQRKIVALHDLK